MAQRLSTVLLSAPLASSAALAFPPAAGHVLVVPAGFADLPQVDVELYADATAALTATKLYAGILTPLVVADQVTTFAASTDLATHTNHGLKLGDGPLVYGNTGGALPPEIVAGTGYYPVPASANTYKLATTLANALSNVTIDLSADSTGTSTASDVPATSRIVWDAFALLGPAGDGAVALDVQLGYRTTVPHRSRVVAYCVSATISAGNISGALFAVVDA